MKAINSTINKIKEFGWEEVKAFNESEDYDVDIAVLLKQGRVYSIVEATGCSCWDGNYEGWIDLTKKELLKIAKAWTEKGSQNAAQKLGAWILEQKKL